MVETTRDLVSETTRERVFPPWVRWDMTGGLALLTAAEWEWLVETLLVDLLNRDSSRFAETTGFKVRRNLPREECRAILHGLGYFNARDFADLRGKAKRILTDPNNPFQGVRGRPRERLDDLLVLRNLIAHQSPIATRRAKNVYQKWDITTEMQPGRFLFARKRFLVHLEAIWDVEEQMRKFLGLPAREKRHRGHLWLAEFE